MGHDLETEQQVGCGRWWTSKAEPLTHNEQTVGSGKGSVQLVHRLFGPHPGWCWHGVVALFTGLIFMSQEWQDPLLLSAIFIPVGERGIMGLSRLPVLNARFPVNYLCDFKQVI